MFALPNNVTSVPHVLHVGGSTYTYGVVPHLQPPNIMRRQPHVEQHGVVFSVGAVVGSAAVVVGVGVVDVTAMVGSVVVVSAAVAVAVCCGMLLLLLFAVVAGVCRQRWYHSGNRLSSSHCDVAFLPTHIIDCQCCQG